MPRIETYDDEKELLRTIEQLKTDGIQEESITVVSRDPLEKSSFEYTNVNIKSAEGTAWDKIVSFFSSGDSEERVIANLDLNEQEKQKFKNELDNGKILLYVKDNGTDAVAEESVKDDRQDTVQSDGQTKEDATNTTAAGAAGAAGVAGVTAQNDNGGKTETEEAVREDISRENASGEYETSDESTANQIHNPANEKAVSLDKSQEVHDHSRKLQEDDDHLAYGEGTDAHIAVDPSVETDTEENDAEKIERHNNPDYLENQQDDYDYGNKKAVINEAKMDDRRHQHLVDTHNHPELAEEVSHEEEKTKEDGRQLLDKNPDNENRDYSIKNDVNGEQVIRLNDEEQDDERN